MTSLTSQYVGTLGWASARTYAIVEGTIDVGLLTRASDLHLQKFGRPIIDEDFAIVAAGRGDDGGVDGVNRGLITLRQIMDADRDERGALRYRVLGLYDNDYNGRAGFGLVSRMDQRILPYVDIFLLKPVMPAVGDGISDRQIETTIANQAFPQLDWEIEDLCSERLLQKFEANFPAFVMSKTEVNGKIHREIEREGKVELLRLFEAEATFDDAVEMIRLMKLLRGYLGVQYDHIRC
ncbi:MAG TPA: hypothetical protein VF650_17395 [Allosphingosinicella sp.]|jgi:hypothetical protein